MNYKQKQEERKRVKELFLASYPEGCIKLTSGESEIHARVKCQVVHYLKKQNYDCWTEVTFKNGLRADILALHSSGIAYIVEIVNTESDKSLGKKGLEYPLPLIVVKTKDFNYDKFCL